MSAKHGVIIPFLIVLENSGNRWMRTNSGAMMRFEEKGHVSTAVA